MILRTPRITLDDLARFDKLLVPAQHDCRRGLLIEVRAAAGEQSVAPRPPLNLALVIDRSGSMQGARLDAAKRAAAGIVDALGGDDRLSLVSFDHNVTNHFESWAMTERGRRRAHREISQLESGGATDLAAGWHEGARCVAKALDEQSGVSGHVIVLSDGHANRGLLEPEQLTGHAAELAHRGVRTSAAGIGDYYSPLQLDALAEGGQGRLHDAETPQDIVDVVMGELGEIREVVARSLRLVIQYPQGLRAERLTRHPLQEEPGAIEIPVGDICAGRSRQAALMFEVPALPAGEVLSFEGELLWDCPETGSIKQMSVEIPSLTVVDPDEARAAERDLDVVATLADLWEARLAYEAASLNEAGDRVGAYRSVDQAIDEFGLWVRDLDNAQERLRRMDRVASASSRRWEGRSKRDSLVMSKQAMLSESSLLSRDKGVWHDHLED